MLKAFLNAFRVPDLRNKILFTLLIIAIYRFGCHVPVPVVDITALQKAAQRRRVRPASCRSSTCSPAARSDAWPCSGSGIMPYITSSIIMQLLTVVIPKLQQWQDQGEAGTKKINQWTRYLTVVLALLQSTGLVFLFHNQSQSGIDVFPRHRSHRPTSRSSILTFTAGTAMVMWLGELITQRGVGNGMSILIFTSIISRLPSEGTRSCCRAGPASSS